jgi:hypothetical protein
MAWMPTPIRILATLCCAALLAGADDQGPRLDPDRDAPDYGPGLPRGVAQIMLGSAGFEPGVAAEWRWRYEPRLQVRPEVFLNDSSRAGVACSLTWELKTSPNAPIHLPPGQDIFLGPRVAYHNRDQDGWEVGALGIYSIALDPLVAAQPDRDAPRVRAAEPSHFLEILASLGAIEHKHPDDLRFSGTLGLAFAYQF